MIGPATMRHTLRCLYRGQSLLRISMNAALAGHTVRGRVLDVGGGHAPDYFSYFKKAPGTAIEAIDGSMTGIDFETDALPYADASIDTVVLCNVLEHLYEYRHVLREARRVLVEGGSLIGFVPFLIQYHPDPHDYFRYTDEALSRMLNEAGFRQAAVTRVGGGPFLVNFNTLVLSVPRILRVVAYPWYAALDALFLRLRPRARTRYPLGYVFTAVS